MDRRTCLRLLSAAAVMVGTTVALSPPTALASNGLAIMEIFVYPDDIGSSQVVYGEGVSVSIEARDNSGSCIVAFDCDQVEGTAYIIATEFITGAQYLAGTATFEPGLQIGTAFAELPTLYPPAGSYSFDFVYQGNFDSWDTRVGEPIPWIQLYNVITVQKRPCTPTLTVTPPVAPTNAGPIQLVLDLGSSNHTGYVDFTVGGGRIARAAVDPNGRTATASLTFGPDDTTTYQATYSGDANNLGCTSGTATYTVPEPQVGGGQVHVPSPVNDSFTTDLGAILDADVLYNDAQLPISQQIRFPTQQEIDQNPGLPEDVRYLAPPDPTTIGTVSINPDDTITFEPAAAWTGETFAFTYVAFDSADPTRSARARVFVTGRCAVGVGDSYSVQPDTPRSVPGSGVFANDAGKCGGTALLATAPSNGDIDLIADGSFTYTPDTGFRGVDSFQYVASDDPADRPITVLLSVLEGACVPSLGPDSFEVSARSLVVAAPGVAANDELCREVVEVANPPQHGTVILSPTGGITYTADPGYVGPDSFTYGIVDQEIGVNPPTFRADESVTAVDPDVATATVSLNVLADPVVSSTTIEPTTTTVGIASTTTVGGAGGVITTTAPTVPPVGELPATGGRSLPPAILASVFSAAGAALVFASRRRRTI